MGANKECLFVALGATLWKVSAPNIRKASPQETLAQGLIEKFARSLKTNQVVQDCADMSIARGRHNT
eukprot:6458172-Amphidinium_carterae.5